MTRRSYSALALLALLLSPASCSDEDPAGPSGTWPPPDRVRHVPEEYATIQSALNSAVPGDTVLVAPGTYRGGGNRGLDFGGKDLVLLGAGGPDSTIVDCEGAGRGFFLHLDETSASIIDGFTVVRGLASDEGTPFGAGGGGARVDNSSPTIRRCRFISCAGSFGAGIYVSISQSRFEDCAFIGNATGQSNESLDGGGIYAERAELTFQRCLVQGNQARRGGGLHADRATLLFERCTFAGNRALEQGGAAYIRRISDLSVTQSIVHGNGAEAGSEIFTTGSAVSVSCAVADTSGFASDVPVVLDRVVAEDPLFCAPVAPALAPTTEGDYRIAVSSPAAPNLHPCATRIGSESVSCEPGAIL